MNIVEINNISKSYGNIKVLNDISLSISKGEIFGLIGADGAGKTTLFRILTTLITSDSGNAYVEGLDTSTQYRMIRSRIGYMPGHFSLYGDLTVEENLNFFASLFGTTLDQNRELINDIYIQIEPFKKRRASKLSGGMKQKLALCCSLIHAPSVLFLDEPTTGVDPVSRGEFWRMLQRLKDKGLTMIVSTPYMDEARQCDRITFLKEGEILETDTPANIINKFGEVLYAISADRMHPLLSDTRKYKGVKSCYAFGSKHHFTVDNLSFSISDFQSFLAQKGYNNIQINSIVPTIEDCYMNLVENGSNKNSIQQSGNNNEPNHE